MKPGYAYHFTGDGSWNDGPSDDWETGMQSGGKAEFLGTRSIDGSMCTVWKRDGEVFAQLAHMAPAPSAKARAPKPPKNAGPAIAVLRVTLDRGGYDKRGRYFGIGEPLWSFESDDGESHGHIRAKDKAAAKAEVKAKYPTARVR